MFDQSWEHLAVCKSCTHRVNPIHCVCLIGTTCFEQHTCVCCFSLVCCRCAQAQCSMVCSMRLNVDDIQQRAYVAQLPNLFSESPPHQFRVYRNLCSICWFLCNGRTLGGILGPRFICYCDQCLGVAKSLIALSLRWRKGFCFSEGYLAFGLPLGCCHTWAHGRVPASASRFESMDDICWQGAACEL